MVPVAVKELDGCRNVLADLAKQGSRRNLTGQSSVYFDRQITSPWDAYIEYSGAFPQRGGPQNMIDFGTAYKPTPHQQLDFHCNFGLSAATPDHSIGLLLGPVPGVSIQ